MKTHTIDAVRDIPADYTLLQDTQDICAVMYDTGIIDVMQYGCLFARVIDGEYTSIYGCLTYVPYLYAQVFKLL